MTEFGKSTFKSNRIAEASSSFFIGSESDTYEATGTTYFSTSYEKNIDNCFTYIRLGTQEKTPFLLGKTKDINLDNFATLQEK